MTDNSNKNTQQNDEFARQLHRIARARTLLLVCFLTFPLYAVIVTWLLNEGNDITWLMFVYMAIYAGFGINMALKRCPRCHEQFYVREYFLNPFPRRCVHCAQAARPDQL